MKILKNKKIIFSIVSIIIIIIFILLITLIVLFCKNNYQIKPHVIDNVETFDEMITNKLNGKYDESLAYDLRTQNECEKGHIKGFLCIRSDEDNINEIYQEITKTYKKKAMILLICLDGTESNELALLLTNKGYKNVYYFQGGFLNYISIHPNFIPEIGCDC